MLRRPVFLSACLFSAFFGAISAGVGYFLAAESQRLVTRGVAAVATVTQLLTHHSGSGASPTTVYRVVMRVDEPGGPITLLDNLNGDDWRRLAEGDPLGVVYVPGNDRYCQIGDMATAAATYQRALLVMLLGGAVTGVSLGAAAWVSFSRHGQASLALGQTWWQSRCPA